MKKAFMIMQIGNPDLDDMYKNIYLPIAQECGLSLFRVDKDNEGDLIKKTIDKYIEEAVIIIADLTNERQSCYHEVGYAYGLSKHLNVILTIREDHIPTSRYFNSEGPKIHFDLNDYPRISWKEDEIDKFKGDLKQEIKRRLSEIEKKGIMGKSVKKDNVDSNNSAKEKWIMDQQKIAFPNNNKKLGYMEYIMILPAINEKYALEKLVDSAEKAIADRNSVPYKWIFDKRGKYWPRPINQGIVSKINQNEENASKIYIYFAIKDDGTIYFLNSFEEDWEEQGKYLEEIKCIKRITEGLIFASKFYSNLEVPFNSKFFIRIKYGNLLGRTFLFHGSHTFYTHRRNQFKTIASEFPYELKGDLKDINEKNLSNLVENSVKGIFELFDYFKEEKSVISKCVDIYMDKWK